MVEPQSGDRQHAEAILDRKSTRLNSSHLVISYAVFCLKKKKKHSYNFIFANQASNSTHSSPSQSQTNRALYNCAPRCDVPLIISPFHLHALSCASVTIA